MARPGISPLLERWAAPLQSLKRATPPLLLSNVFTLQLSLVHAPAASASHANSPLLTVRKQQLLLTFYTCLTLLNVPLALFPVKCSGYSKRHRFIFHKTFLAPLHGELYWSCGFRVPASGRLSFPPLRSTPRCIDYGFGTPNTWWSVIGILSLLTVLLHNVIVTIRIK